MPAPLASQFAYTSSLLVCRLTRRQTVLAVAIIHAIYTVNGPNESSLVDKDQWTRVTKNWH